MSNSSQIILESLTEITVAISSNPGIEISRMEANLAFSITNAQWTWLVTSYKCRYATAAYPRQGASEKRCNSTSLTSPNPLGLKQWSTCI